jgi:hypothetical protein
LKGCPTESLLLPGADVFVSGPGARMGGALSHFFQVIKFLMFLTVFALVF